jgi:DNA uptake protein ComE-like DNA-binding protein
MAIQQKGLMWRILHSWWILLSFTLFFNWTAFAFIALRVRSWRWGIWAALYAFFSIGLLVTIPTYEQGTWQLTFFTIFGLIGFVVSPVHAFIVCKEYLLRLQGVALVDIRRKQEKHIELIEQIEAEYGVELGMGEQQYEEDEATEEEYDAESDAEEYEEEEEFEEEEETYQKKPAASSSQAYFYDTVNTPASAKPNTNAKANGTVSANKVFQSLDEEFASLNQAFDAIDRSIDGMPTAEFRLDSTRSHAQKTQETPATPAKALLDINTASEEQLSGLPSMGIIMAKKAIALRTETGEFTSVDAFGQVLGLQPHVMERIRPLITVSVLPKSPQPPRRGGRVVDF